MIFNLKRECDAPGVLMLRNPRVFVVHTCNPSKTGRVKDILSTKTGVWVDTKSKKDTSVHEMRRFCGYEQQFDGNFQEKGHFLGRQGGKTKKVCDIHTIAERLRLCVIPVYGSRLGSRPVDQSSPIHKERMG